MAKCSFCGKVVEFGTGKNVVVNSGRIYDLCSMKCEKNMFKLKRKARNLKWTKYYNKK